MRSCVLLLVFTHILVAHEFPDPPYLAVKEEVQEKEEKEKWDMWKWLGLGGLVILHLFLRGSSPPATPDSSVWEAEGAKEFADLSNK